MDGDDLTEQIRHLEVAVAHRTVIGIGIGVLMVRNGVTREEAFEQLKHLASVHERKVYDLCSEIAATGKAPSLTR